MNEICIFFTAQGQLIGEVVEDFIDDGIHRLKNPAILINQGTSAQFIPLASFVEAEVFELHADQLLFRNKFTPIIPVVNKYREIFGSGIQIANVMPAR